MRAIFLQSLRHAEKLVYDRLIIDARPANLLQPSDTRWMTSFTCLLHVELDPQEGLLLSASDNRFLPQCPDISRALDFVPLCGQVPASKVQHLSCFDRCLFRSGRFERIFSGRPLMFGLFCELPLSQKCVAAPPMTSLFGAGGFGRSLGSYPKP